MMSARRGTAGDLHVDERVAIAEHVIGDQSLVYHEQSLYRWRPHDRELAQAVGKPREVTLRLERSPAHHTRDLVHPVTEVEPAIIDGDRRLHTRDVASVEVDYGRHAK